MKFVSFVSVDDATCVRCPMMEVRHRPSVRSLLATRERKHSEVSHHICHLHSGSGVEDESFASRICPLHRQVFPSRLLLFANPRTPLNILSMLQYKVHPSTSNSKRHQLDHRHYLSLVDQVTLVYFCVTGLDLLGKLGTLTKAQKEAVKEWVLAQQVHRVGDMSGAVVHRGRVRCLTNSHLSKV